MQDILQPLINKAQIRGLRVNVTKTGLCIGDTAHLRLLEDGQIAVYARGNQPWLGFIPRSRTLRLGQMGPSATAMLTTPLQDEMHLRVRIVGLTPEHLSPSRQAEVCVSVWGTLPPSLTPPPLGA